MVLERTLGRPLDCKEIQPVHPKGNQPWIFIGRTDAETETPILWPIDMKSSLTVKDPDARKDWGQEKWVTEDEMIGWHHWLNGHELEQTLGDSEAQGSLEAAVHGVTIFRHDLGTEWQQSCLYYDPAHITWPILSAWDEITSKSLAVNMWGLFSLSKQQQQQQSLSIPLVIDSLLCETIGYLCFPWFHWI